MNRNRRQKIFDKEYDCVVSDDSTTAIIVSDAVEFPEGYVKAKAPARQITVGAIEHEKRTYVLFGTTLINIDQLPERHEIEEIWYQDSEIEAPLFIKHKGSWTVIAPLDSSDYEWGHP